MLSKWSFEFKYRFSRPPWDTGITPPELVSLVESGGLAPGWALDLGCGTGTNSIYLARHDLQVVGVDFSPQAIAQARAKAHQANAKSEFHEGDVTHLDFLTRQFDLVLDIGCYHSLQPDQQTLYVANLSRLTHSGSRFLLYAFGPSQDRRPSLFNSYRNTGVTPEQVQRAFAASFDLDKMDHGQDRGKRASAWYWFTRR